MNGAHFHLAINHLPVWGAIIGWILLSVALFKNSVDLKRFAFQYFVVLGVATVVVYLTGEPAEEVVEQIVGVSESAIEAHEEASLIGLLMLEACAIFSLIGLLRQGALLKKAWYPKVLWVMVLISCATMGWVANLGGQIRHSEIAHVGG